MKHAQREVFAVDLMDPPLLLIVSILAATLWMAVPFTRAQRVDTPDVRPDVATECETLQQAIREAQEEQSRLDQEAGSLDRALAETHGQLQQAAGERAPKTAEAERLAQELIRQRDLLAKLQQDLENAQTPHVGDVVGAPVAIGTEKAHVGFELVNDRIVELTDENYQTERFLGPNGQQVLVASRIADGESITEIEHQSSRFMTRLNELRPDRHAVIVLVHSDSFPVFRTVRDIARKRGFEVGWEPFTWSDGKIVFSASGRNIPVQQPR